MSAPLVVITGISGYLGSQTCLAFLKDGSFRVRGTVRSTSNEAKLKPLREGFGDLFKNVELFEADLTDEASLVRACAGATYVVHTASPFNFGGDCVGPAVAGTQAIMKACVEHKVKRVVVTSSVAAVQCVADADKPNKDKGEMFDESHWSNPDRPQGLMDYMKSKTLAERVVWEVQAANPSMEAVTINPTFIMGPSACAGDGTSEAWMKQVLDGSKTEIPTGGNSFVDVRDVALAHVKAVTVPAAANKRFILYNQRVLLREVYGWLQQYNAKGAKVPTVQAAGEDSTDFDLLNNARSREVLGVDYTPMKQTMCDHAESMLARGLVGK